MQADDRCASSCRCGLPTLRDLERLGLDALPGHTYCIFGCCPTPAAA